MIRFSTQNLFALAIVFVMFFSCLIGYIIRIENQMATLSTDIKWIKGVLEKCQPTSEKVSR